MSTLYIVATPIGNLEDITLRALRIFKEVDLIICEDTRVTGKLLSHYEIKKSLVSYHHHSKLDKISYIISRLQKGENAALVSDAGTPGISDPGGILVRELLNKNKLIDESYRVKIVPIPGASAVLALASVSGMPMDKFMFMGFPPHKKGRQTFFKEVLKSDFAVVFYESSHRITKALKELEALAAEKGSEIQLIVGRELTKMFETVYRGNINEVESQLAEKKENLKGEFTVIVNHTDAKRKEENNDWNL